MDFTHSFCGTDVSCPPPDKCNFWNGIVLKVVFFEVFELREVLLLNTNTQLQLKKDLHVSFVFYLETGR